MKEIKSKVYKILSELFSVSESEITDEVGPGDLAKWDSIGQLRLILELEDQFDIQLSVDDVISINNVRDIINLINKFVQDGEKKLKGHVAFSSTFHPVRFPSTTYWGKNSISVIKTFDLNRLAIITGASKYADDIIEKLSEFIPVNTIFQVFKKSKGEPIESDIMKLSEMLHEFSPSEIIAIGGGSTIDIAKLSWLLYERPDFRLCDVDGSIVNLKPHKKASFIAAPTTFGSGSEVSSSAAFTKENDLGKSILVSHDFIPNQVILDPLLAESANLITIYSSAFDALTHALEGYVSIVSHPMLEPIAIRTIIDIIKAMKTIISEGVSSDVLGTLCYSAYYAGIVQNHCSVGLTHSFAHQLSHYGISHGIANAMFLIPVIEYNSRKVNKYNNLAIEVGFKSVIDFKEEINEILNESSIIPSKDILRKMINDKTTIIQGAMNDITFRTNPVILGQSEVETVFNNAMEGLINA